MNTRRKPRRVVLAFSGGLNSTVAIPWLAATADAAEAAAPAGAAAAAEGQLEVVTVSLDLGQAGEL
jgi:argininosuccinate synthase